MAEAGAIPRPYHFFVGSVGYLRLEQSRISGSKSSNGLFSIQTFLERFFFASKYRTELGAGD